MDDPGTKTKAFHEAGHAVASYLIFGHEFGELSVDNDDPGLGARLRERARSWRAPSEEVDAGARQQIEEQAMAIFAGPLAEQRAGDSSTPDDDDRAAALELALQATEGDLEEAEAYVEWLVLRARRLMGRYDVWPAVEALAQALQSSGHLSYEDAVSLIERTRSDIHRRDITEDPVLGKRS